MKMRTADLIGAALDWAAAKVLGIETYGPEDFRNLRNRTTKNGEYVYRWSQSWAQTGPIIEERGMTLMRMSNGEWATEINNRPRCYGPTPMVAAMRSLVYCYFGATVEIPDELL